MQEDGDKYYKAEAFSCVTLFTHYLNQLVLGMILLQNIEAPRASPSDKE